MNKIFLLLSLCITFMITSSCGSKKKAAPPTAPPVMIMTTPITPQEFASEETHWTATEVFGDEKIKAIGSGISFYPQVDNFSGSAACNAYSGKLTLDAHGGIRMQEIISTRMACENMAYEQKFFEAIAQADRYRLIGKMLLLYRGKNEKPLVSFSLEQKGKQESN